MQHKSPATKSYQERLQFLSQIYALVGPISILAICATGEFFYNYYAPSSKRYMGPILIFMFMILAARIVKPHASRARLAFEYGVITSFNVVAFNFFLHFPSPYLFGGAVFAVLVYFDFGFEWAVLSLLYQYGSVVVNAVAFKHDSASQIIDILAYVLAPSALGFMIIRLQSLTRQEISSIESNTAEALSNKQQIQSLINNISDGVLAVDQNNRIVIYNAAALDVLDVNTAVNDMRIDTVLKPIDAESQPVDILKLLKGVTTPTNNRDLKLKYSDGSTANIFLGIAPIYLGFGKSQNNGYTIIMRDITREKSLEEERDEFISVVSHELRTPIAITEGSISNAQFIAEKTGDMDVIRKTLKESHNQVIFLADMINDLSTLSRAERGKLEIDIATIDIHELVTELAANYGPQAETKGLVIKTSVAKAIGDLESSKLYVREILQNFITNAVKYTEKGSVTIKASSTAKGVNFEVIDTGIGISKSDQNKVFDKFFRSEDYRTRANNGTGLGLYVTMKLVRLIHADIDVASELNKGSTFKIFIPNLKVPDIK